MILNIFVDRFCEQVEQTNADIKKCVGGDENIMITRAQITELSNRLDNDIPVFEKKKEAE